MMDRVMCAVLGRILLVEAAFLLPPLALCLWDGDAQDARAFVWAAALCAAVGFALCAVGPAQRQARRISGAQRLCHRGPCVDSHQPVRRAALLAQRGHPPLC